MWPSCQSPYISFPMAQNLTPQGSGWPLAVRSLPILVSAAPLTYSSSSRAMTTSPWPLLTAM